MNAYVLSRGAEQDLDDLWDYIADESLDAADRLIGEIFDAIEELARFPGIGHKRKDLTNFPVLFWPVGNYLERVSNIDDFDSWAPLRADFQGSCEDCRNAESHF